MPCTYIRGRSLLCSWPASEQLRHALCKPAYISSKTVSELCTACLFCICLPCDDLLGWAQVLNEAGEQSSSKLSLSTLLDIVAPVLQQFVLEGKAAEDSGHEIKQVSSGA